MPIGRYLKNEAAFKIDAYAVLKTHFGGRRAFNQYYDGISKAKLNDFLRVCSSYRYLAKHGDWKIKVRPYNSVIGYLTNTYKLIAVFSLIESLSDLDHLDFYQWLTAKSRVQVFPIEDKAKLENHYREYKMEYGAIRRCVAFFLGLPLDEQKLLCGSISVNMQLTAEIKKLAQFLYNLRSGFVHKAEFAHELDGPVFVIKKAGLVESKLTIGHILRAFERGVIEHFRGDDTQLRSTRT